MINCRKVIERQVNQVGLWEKAVNLMEQWGIVAHEHFPRNDADDYGPLIDRVARNTNTHPALVSVIQKQLGLTSRQALDASALSREVERRALLFTPEQVAHIVEADALDRNNQSPGWRLG
jgi:hypothetical protein